MTHYVVSAQAGHDVTEIIDFIALDSIGAARSVKQDLDAAMQRLAELPNIGHRRPGLPDDVRLWPVHSYLIAYRAESDAVLVLRVLSGFRDLERLLG